MAKTVEFPDVRPYWLFDRDSVQYLALVDGKPVKGLVTIEALMRQYGIGYGREQALDAYDAHRQEIREIARRKIEAGSINEERGEVVIDASDIERGAWPQHIDVHVGEVVRPRESAMASKMHIDPDIRANPALLEDVRAAHELLERFLGRLASEVEIAWNAVKQGKHLVELLVADREYGLEYRDWFSADQLRDRKFLGMRIGSLVGVYLQDRNHKLLQRIESERTEP